MRRFSFRGRERFRKAMIGLLIACGVAIVLMVAAYFFLARYIVYTSDGAHLDFGAEERAAAILKTNFQVEPPASIPGADLVEDTEPEEPQAPTRITGYYVDAAMLEDMAGLRSALGGIAVPTAVMIDVRSVYGNYYYATGIEGAETSALVDPSVVSTLIDELDANPSVYLIASLPAFCDPAYALAHQSCGISLPSGALWMDGNGCYWLDPASDEVIAYLELAARELRGLGFDEIAFSDFFVPDAAVVYYKGNAGDAVTEAARRLSANLGDLPVSFVSRNTALAPYAKHIFIQEENGAEVLTLRAEFEGAFDSLTEHLVFLTSSRDTRFEDYGILKPAIDVDE